VVGVRLDPVIRYQWWEKDYQGMLEELLSVLDNRRIDYISLGTAKLHKLLLEAMGSRFTESPIILDEIVPSADGKYRYVKFRRVDVYRKMISWIRKVDKRLRVELSMESDEVKRLVFD
jgi:spore photoproduct lyase